MFQQDLKTEEESTVACYCRRSCLHRRWRSPSPVGEGARQSATRSPHVVLLCQRSPRATVAPRLSSASAPPQLPSVAFPIVAAGRSFTHQHGPFRARVVTTLRRWRTQGIGRRQYLPKVRARTGWFLAPSSRWKLLTTPNLAVAGDGDGSTSRGVQQCWGWRFDLGARAPVILSQGDDAAVY
jgi:hypothetical protein